MVTLCMLHTKAAPTISRLLAMLAALLVAIQPASSQLRIEIT